ncbi:hypothetical protein [uncultured Pseudokineococcus sp.]|uniref:hypothetical protein n=1 Tax=uncultured Pseudokineococcus sp. TaxID=1642928 RepID=UPI0026317295|nr:hypothetical protein [uncultured Pseudokineococcus sp.]
MATTTSARGARTALALLTTVASVLVGGCSSARAGEESSTPPCPPPARGDALIDWVPFVVVDGQMYATSYDSLEEVLEEDQVSDVITTVTCRIADVGDPDFEPRDGDAAYLAVGTQVHQVRGRAPAEALTAYEEGAWRLFEPVDD